MQHSEHYLTILAITLCSTVLVGWLFFFYVVMKSGDKVKDLLTGTSFLQNLTVIGIVTGTACLAIDGILKAELVGSIYSGIARYVLGSESQRRRLNQGAKRDQTKLSNDEAGADSGSPP